jgi:hypothetical protein
MARSLNPERDARVFELRELGASNEALAAQFDISIRMVQYILENERDRRHPQGVKVALRDKRLARRVAKERDEAIWMDYIGGMRVEQIALKYGIKTNYTNTVVNKMGKKFADSQETLDHWRTRISHGTLEVMAKMTELMRAEPIPAYSNGKPILSDPDDPTSIASDYSTRINAAKVLLIAQKRLSDMLGLDAAMQIDINLTAQASEQAATAAEEALARVTATVYNLTAAQIEQGESALQGEGGELAVASLDD